MSSPPRKLLSPPLSSTKPLLLLLPSLPSPSLSSDDDAAFSPILNSVNLDLPISDPEANAFRSGGVAVVAGFALFFPHYPSFLAKQGLYIEQLFVRECYPKQGFGKMLLSAVAGQAAKMGYVRVDWAVVDWNVNAINFYQEMGAQVWPGWRLCRLGGDALQAFAHNKP